MTLFILAYLGGVLTIISPCVLPVLPFVLARADRAFLKEGLPLLVGMALAFTGVASLAAVAGGWAIQANSFGRWLAIGLLVFFALSLLLPRLADWLVRPLVALGGRMAGAASERSHSRSLLASVMVGVATGLLWSPCAGPVLGLILSAAAIAGPSAGTSWLLLAYAAGAATSMAAAALLLGGRVSAWLRRSLAAGQWARRAAGVMVLGGVALIASGLDTGLLSQLSLASTSRIEQRLIDTLRPAPGQAVEVSMNSQPSAQLISVAAAQAPALERAPAGTGVFAPFDGATGWINSPALNSASLRGKVVLVDFWTYSCINCLRTLPYIRAWADKYRDAGLVVVGVHSPEFAFEKAPDNVRRAVMDLGITYPVAIDSNHAIWRGFRNQYWPALYFVDAQGKIRHHVFGEGQYEESERMLQKLLSESGASALPNGLAVVDGQGAQAAPGIKALSGEAYLGYQRADGFISAGGIRARRPAVYTLADKPGLNQWSLGGSWNVEAERAEAINTDGRLAFRFHARDLHLVMGRDSGGKPVRFRVTVDGKPPSGSQGTDVDAQGNGLVDAHRLYQLVRQGDGRAGSHLFEIEFLDPGVHLYAFTFG